jgi:hypothetical protein
VLNGNLQCQEKGKESAASSAGSAPKHKHNFREILVQVIAALGIPAWRESAIDGFLSIAEDETMVDLLEPLPKDKRPLIFNEVFKPLTIPRDIEQLFSPYYTLAHIQAAMVTRMKKQVAQHIVNLVEPPPTPAQRERVLALLNKLSFRK